MDPVVLAQAGADRFENAAMHRPAMQHDQVRAAAVGFNVEL
jgi:hypothetical protein